MNEKNLDYLKNQVKFTGFGEGLDNELAEQLQKLQPEFKLQHRAVYGKDEAEATLHFKKSTESDLYFFNRYDLHLKQGQSNEPLKQTFYVGRENNVTAKEAYNLLAGRSVYKDMTKMEKVGEGENMRFKPTEEKYEAWKQLNFKQTDEQGNFKQRLFFESHGFDLEKALAKLPLKEMEDNYDKSRLAESLKKGNLQKVTLTEDGKEQKLFIEANPKDKTINIYDSNMQRIDLKQIQVEKLSQGEANSVRQQENNKESHKQDSPGENQSNKASEKKKQHMKVS